MAALGCGSWPTPWRTLAVHGVTPVMMQGSAGRFMMSDGVPVQQREAALGAVLPPLRSADPEREAVSAGGDAERPLPDARRKQHGANGGRN